MLNWKSLNWNRIGLHVLFWAVYLPLNAVLSNIMYGQPVQQAFGGALVAETFSLPVKILLTYFVFYYIIPTYLERNKAGKLVFTLIVAFAVTILVYRLMMGFTYAPLFQAGKEVDFFSVRAVLLTAFDCFITLAAACTIKFIRLHYESLEFEQQLVREKLESELSFLRAQTNPHFLFNTLNNLYGLARKKSDKTADAIMMLSKILRFVLYECRAPRVAVGAEAQVMRDYIELEKLRYTERLTVRFTENMDYPDTQIAPLMMLPFVENTIKHGAGNSTGDVEILIDLTLKDQHLSFKVKNTVEADAKPSSGSGIGLQNVQRQLDLLYPNRHSLSIGKEAGYFLVDMEVDLS